MWWLELWGASDILRTLGPVVGSLVILHWLDVLEELRYIIQSMHGGRVRDLRAHNNALRKELVKCTCGRGRHDKPAVTDEVSKKRQEKSKKTLG